MKKWISLLLIALLLVGSLAGCARGKTVMLLVEDTRTDETRLLWAGFSQRAKKAGMKAVLVGLTDENEISMTAYQVWEEAVTTQDPDVVAVVGLSYYGEAYGFLTEGDRPLVAINPDTDLYIPDAFCISGATDLALARLAAEQIIEMAPPSSGRIRLLYNRDNTELADVFTAMMEEAEYLNLETTPLSGRVSEQSILNSFTEDTVAAYNASKYDTTAQDVNNFILSIATRAHLEALQNGQAASLWCRDYETIGKQAAEAAIKAMRGKDPYTVAVDPIRITANGPDRNGAAYWLALLG